MWLTRRAWGSRPHEGSRRSSSSAGSKQIRSDAPLVAGSSGLKAQHHAPDMWRGGQRGPSQARMLQQQCTNQAGQD